MNGNKVIDKAQNEDFQMTRGENSKTFIWGAKSKLRILLPYLSAMGRKPDYVFDEFIEGIGFDFDGIHFKDQKKIELYTSKCDAYVVAIGGQNGKIRNDIATRLQKNYSLFPLNIIHPTVYICETVQLGSGLMMMPRSIINSYTKVGDNCIINTNASIDHECTIGHGVHVMGGAVVTGRVTIGDYATIGSNATILPDLEVGEGAFIGAGAVVTKNVPAGVTVVGIPAGRIISK